MPSPCDGLTVIDLTWGMPGGIATMVLSDFGAEVTKIEPPRGDPFRSHPGFLLWNRGKKSVALDLKSHEGREQAQRLAADADVLVEGFRPGVAGRLGLGYQALESQNPGLVYCSISPFGQTGPYRNYKGYEGIVAAKTGRMMNFAGQTEREGPVYAAVQVGCHAAAQAAVHGIMAALLVRERTGRGQRVETSLAQGMIPYDLVGLFFRHLRRTSPESLPPIADPLAARRRGATLQYLPVQTRDGRWMQMANNLERLFHAWVRAIGLWELFEDPRFMNAPNLPDEDRDAMREILLKRMREKTLNEWMEIFVENGNVAADAFLSTQEGMAHEQVTWNGNVVDVDDPRVGTMKQVGLIADLKDTPGRIPGPAPDLGAHTGELLHRASDAGGTRAPANAPSGSPLRHPLDGVSVLELATVIAGPLAGCLMADFGARVIKVEPPEGDPGRPMVGQIGALGVKTTAGKESICIDLKTDEGREIVHKLVRQADVLLHNYRPGVAERLGMGYETARAFNPRLVYVAVTGYGSTGPHSHRPVFHPVPGALLGGALLQAGNGTPPPADRELTWDEVRAVSRRLFRANEANPDPNTSMVIVSAALLALYARERTGRGQEVQVNMLAGNAYANADDLFSYEGKPERLSPDSECYGLSALYRLYPAREGWVFLACVFQHEWEALCEAIERPDLRSDPRFATVEVRRSNDDALAEALTRVFAKRTADEWERMLIEADVACVRADGHANAGSFFDTDPHARENAFVEEADHVRFGRYPRHGAVVRLPELPGRFGPAVLAGQHTREILSSLGYDDASIARLKERGVANWEEA